ncbi:TIGR02757 family protein [Tunicatimonas pelagia]|uniref:TIGR02757 family protein n=1 Tax=Tunicatimonas pelagia TaxID=931531 RepID=UPI00266716CE|nr:TIGR02757 family protein [Tunicatimonas pelagia]WKN45735.1 TIGR02757 family protein [Tunicatimonas pelagia]
MRKFAELRNFLEEQHDRYNRPAFIASDPISIPHQYQKKQDIEISGFVAAVLAWGQRKTIINKCEEFFSYMDNTPHDFILHHQEDDLKPFLNFKHRTFNATDALYFIVFFRHFYQQHNSLEEAFWQGMSEESPTVESGLTHFHDLFFSLPDYPTRTRKHVATPERNSACKRLNMYLRWMVRQDDRGVDFGIWHKIRPDQLVCPCDVHVDRVARQLGLITRKPTDWRTAVELTENLQKFDPTDPVKYDFALFGLGSNNQSTVSSS